MTDPSTIGKLRCYCLCGATMSADIRGAAAARTVKDLRAIFDKVHKGKGHGQATARQAAAARRRAEDEYERTYMKQGVGRG